MTRAIDAGTATGLQQQVVRPVYIGRLDIAGDPVVAWTGPGLYAPTGTGDLALDGQIFNPLDAPISISDIDESGGIAGPTTIVMAGHDLDEILLRQVVRDRRVWQGRKSWLWLGLLNAAESALVGAPIRITSGVISMIEISRTGADASVAVTIDQDLATARTTAYRWVNHARVYATDTASTFIAKLFNRPTGVKGGVGGGGNIGKGVDRGGFLDRFVER